MFQSSFFSESRLCTRRLFSHFVTNLDRLAGQPIQIFLQSRFRIQIFYVFPHGVNPVGDNCMMMKASLRRGRQCNGSVLGLCWIDDGPLSLLSLSSFGILIASVTTGGIVAVWCHRCHRCHCRRSLPLLPLLPSSLFSPSLPSLPLPFLTLSLSPLPPLLSP